ncbi:MAG: CCA tRNA nucleotidyltransferase, partial [Alphaproteobacteria bacterium]|nr:CCA tRNA nucleotidyltransferase [Alphaproteobacteria bacterium]
MNETLKPDWLAWPQTQALVAAFAGQGDVLRFVGGAVRDALLGRAVKDVDAATSLPPEQVMAVLARAQLQAIPTGIKHGTVTALVEGKPFEITTLRRDMTCDGRHAEVEFTA